MLKYRFARMSHRRLAWSLCIALLIAVCAGRAWTSRRESDARATTSEKRHYTAAEIQQRALKLCLTFSDATRMVSPPVCEDKDYYEMQNGQCRIGHRALWTTEFEADGKSYYLDYNDLTGNLMGIRPQRIEQGMAVQQIQTPEASASIARIRLQEMGLVPAGAKLRLKETPTHHDTHRTWKTTWNVVSPTSTEPYQIQFTLNDADGKPVRVVDDKEAYMDPQNRGSHTQVARTGTAPIR